MARHATIRSFVLAVEFRVAEPDRVGAVLQRHQNSLIDIDAHYAFVYESIVAPEEVLVIIGIRTEQTLLTLLRSPFFFRWFDAVGVDDIPAVFAGETVERFDIGEPPAPGTGVVVVAVTPVEDVEDFVAHVSGSVDEFARAGIRRTLICRAFDTPREVMFLQQLASADHALKWVTCSTTASAWLAAAGIGAYPPVFVGRLVTAKYLDEAAGMGSH